ncbi:uroporphyrinogen-III synthase [Halapricum hydrolyticum]|uniref:Uroporphyrinogen-III synthase n=1 Tax=Halapricum hydrolyticum TaxID=2979991 RepID=A0AAE3LK15_9EURY|nr:uroporphyrinogen-III synthase [Halapricum hydrolyticum]MCU4718994.1 uroporphyrinogen-III synthase [Halapricum hydrolyticum]MCU4727923.1 uroporphyrinogen-III synthase [Halapricum hydrolyticum]
MTTVPRVAVFRPDDDRLARAVELLESLDMEAIADPMLAVEPAGSTPRSDADVVVFTSTTGVDLVANTEWTPDDATICAIGETTAQALRDTGFEVDVVPETYTSGGLVEALESEVESARVELARSDHGSPVLVDGLFEAGGYVHETVLYRLVRPDGAGESAEMAAAGELDAALFTSSLTVEHFLEAATERGVREAAIDGLNEAVVGTIGPPTKETAESNGIDVDVVPETADFERLARAVVEQLQSN